MEHVFLATSSHNVLPIVLERGLDNWTRLRETPQCLKAFCIHGSDTTKPQMQGADAGVGIGMWWEGFL